MRLLIQHRRSRRHRLPTSRRRNSSNDRRKKMGKRILRTNKRLQNKTLKKQPQTKRQRTKTRKLCKSSRKTTKTIQRHRHKLPNSKTNSMPNRNSIRLRKSMVQRHLETSTIYPNNSLRPRNRTKPHIPKQNRKRPRTR